MPKPPIKFKLKVPKPSTETIKSVHEEKFTPTCKLCGKKHWPLDPSCIGKKGARAEIKAQIEAKKRAKAEANAEAKMRAEAERMAISEARTRAKEEERKRAKAEAKIRSLSEAGARAKAEAIRRETEEASGAQQGDRGTFGPISQNVCYQ